MALDNVVGNLRDAYRQIEPGTIQPAAAIQVERHTDESLRDVWFYVPEGPLYYRGEGREIKAGGHVMLAITAEKDNLVLRHLDDAVESENSFAQLTNNKDYFPKRDEAVASINATETIVVDLSQVRLKDEEKEFRYLEIGTSPVQYNQLNDEERKLASVYFGSIEQKEDKTLKNDFEITMEKLREKNILSTRVYVVNPDYVVKNTSERKPVIARASWLLDFGNDSSADADNRNINGTSRVRGVRRVVVENAPERIDLSQQQLASKMQSSSGNLETIMREFNLKDEAEVRKAFTFYTHNREMLK